MTRGAVCSKAAVCGAAVLVLLTAWARSPVDAAQCSTSDFRCNDDRCTSIWNKCNGADNCRDGSDESPAVCNAPNVSLSVGDEVTASVLQKERDNYPMFLLCDEQGQECSRLVVTKGLEEGRLAYWAKIRCNREGETCAEWPHSDSRYGHFPGEVLLHVQHRPSELAVWLKDHPDKAVTVAASKSQTRLRIRPWRWSSDMPVQLNVVTKSAPSCRQYEFQCGDGQCVSIWKKCSGVPDCKDGSDESPALCSAANRTLSVGEVVAVRVPHKGDDNYPMFLLCDEQDVKCSRLVVTQASSATPGSLAYWAKTGCNREGETCSASPHSDSQYGHFSGEVVFNVQRRPSQLAVWQAGFPDKAVTVATSEGQTRLRIRPWMWTSPLSVRFNEKCSSAQCSLGDGCGEACDGRVDCPDGADEDSRQCHVLGIKMPIDTEVNAELTYNQSIHEQLKFILCDNSSCSAVILHGVTHGGELAYDTFVDCSSMGWYCKPHQQMKRDGAAWPTTYMHVRMIRRDDKWTLWLPRFPENSISVPSKPSYFRLQARGSNSQPIIPAIFTGTDERRFASTVPQCGWAPKATTALTLNGESVSPGAFPWHAALYLKAEYGRYKYICGANLISPSVLVTAAHCVFKNDVMKPAGEFAVALGKVYSGWDDDEVATVFKSNVKRIFPHPLYRGRKRKYSADIALIEMTQPVTFSETIFPICLGHSHNKVEKVQVVGWGDDHETLEELQAVTLPVRGFDECVKAYTGVPHELGFVTEDKICTTRPTGVERPPGLARGDSGSGAVQLLENQWHLMGLVSVALDSGKLYGFTDVRRYWGWIHESYREVTPEHNGTFLL